MQYQIELPLLTLEELEKLKQDTDDGTLVLDSLNTDKLANYLAARKTRVEILEGLYDLTS
jgi:hypothetical protein